MPRGLRSRDAILSQLNEEEWTMVSDVASVLDLSQGTVLYHLRNLKMDGYVEKEQAGKRWRLIEFPQGILTDYLKKKRKSSPKKRKAR